MNDYRCDHDPAAVCWLCSDQVPWWAEAREKAGLGRALLRPSRRLHEGPVYARERPTCVDCGRTVVTGPRCMSCASSSREEVKAEALMARSMPLGKRYG